MYDPLSLLQLYSEWGADESLVSSSIDHLSDKTPILPTFKKQPVANTPPPKTDQHPALYATNLQEINQAILTFTTCTLKDTATHTVLPAGDPHAPIYIIGDIPNADEDRYGQVFHGMTEFWLTQMLASINLSLDHCFRMPLIPWRPPGGRQPSKNELDLCLPFLYRILTLYTPSHILTTGQLAARILLQNQSTFSQLRGKWHQYKNPEITGKKDLHLFPLYHLSQINMNGKIRKATWQDLLQIRAVIEGNS